MATKERLTIEQFLGQHAVKMTATRTAKNPHMADSDAMDHWYCTLVCGADKMHVYFSKGYGLHGERPTVREVIDCLASDAASYDNARGFEDWCRDFGFDTDSRKAERTYRTVERQRNGLEQLLGPSAYAALLWQTERL